MEIGNLEWIETKLEMLEKKMLSRVQQYRNKIQAVHIRQVRAAVNMLHYLVLRSEDMRELQDVLHVNGLSSLASSESHIHRQLQSIRQRLGKKYSVKEIDKCTNEWARKSIADKCDALFGKRTAGAGPHIMVTFDSSFADNYALIKNLLQNGMSVARINCAHDDEAVWSKMIHHIRRAIRQSGIDCKIYMDLAGPKIRVRLLNKGKSAGKVKIKEGDLIWLSETAKGFEKNDIVLSPDEPGIISCLQKGERVYIDDGIIKGVIETVKKARVAMRIVRISSDKHQIKEAKGINFPDSTIKVPSLTAYDKKCLPFICNYADMLGYSFVRSGADVENLQAELKKLSRNPPHVIIKIETPEAVENLPSLLLSGMSRSVFGVMIARGDLAVEIGFERLGEIQEEILWICESAHVPVIWATQVLETLNKSGVATRSEITDAVHAAMAECVMINKGDHTIKVIETLNDIFQRSGGHHVKKRFTFRPLNIASAFFQNR